MFLGTDPGQETAIITWPDVLVDDELDTPDVASTHDSGDAFPIGVTTVTVTATDSDGLEATCSFDVTVSGKFLMGFSVEALTYVFRSKT